MTKTKRALLMSVLSLLLCFSMLIGSTFAWFTDSVTSNNNIIKSGNLDVELKYWDGDSWEKVTATTNVFEENTLWEPGHTEVVYLEVSNLGTLALKYNLGINIVNEVESINVAGEALRLSDYIVFDAIEGVESPYADRAAARAAVTEADVQKLSAGYTLPGEIKAGEPAEYVALVVYMPETTGNEANYRTGEVAPEITLGLNLLATQETYEKDSFDEKYDELALVTSVDALKTAIAKGGTVMLGADLTVDANETITVADDANVRLEMNGHMITGISTEAGANRKIFTVKGEMTVLGGTITMEHTGDNMAWNNLSAPFSVEGGKLTLGEGTTVINNGGTDMAYAVDVNTTLGETELNVDGATLVSSYIGVRIFNNHKTATGTVNYNAGIIEGKKDGYDIWAQLMNCPAENAVVNIADSFTWTELDKSGKIYQVETPTIVNTVAGLQNAINTAKDGEVIVLVNDMAGNVTIPQTANVKFTIDGKGNTFAGTMTVDGKSATITTAGITIKNVNFTAAAEAVTTEACINMGVDGNNNTRYICNLTVENCQFNVPGKVAVKSYGNGDHVLTITGCTVSKEMHSLVQVNNVAGGIKITDCKVYSKNGININQSESLTVIGCEISVRGYAVRCGASSGATGNVETYRIENCTLTTDGSEGDKAVILRGTAESATLTIVSSTIIGDISNAANATIVQ